VSDIGYNHVRLEEYGGKVDDIHILSLHLKVGRAFRSLLLEETLLRLCSSAATGRIVAVEVAANRVAGIVVGSRVVVRLVLHSGRG